MEAAGIFGSPVKEGEKSDMDTDDDEEAGEQAVGKAKGKGKATATSSVPRRTSSRVKGKAPESDGGPPDVPDGGESAASGQARASRADEFGQDDEASDDGEEDDDDEEDAPGEAVDSGPGGSLAVLAEGAAAAPRVQKKD